MLFNFKRIFLKKQQIYNQAVACKGCVKHDLV